MVSTRLSPMRIALLGAALITIAWSSVASAAKSEEPTVPEIMEKARHGYGPDRDAAISSLKSLNKEKIKEFKVDKFLMSIIKNGDDAPRLRRRAVEIVVHMASGTDTSLKTRVLGDLVSIMKSSSDANIVRSRIAEAIWRLVDASKSVGADKQAIQALEATVKGKDPVILKIMALKSLARIGSEGSGPVLRAAMTNPDPAVKDAASAALSAWLERRGGSGLKDQTKASLGRLMVPQISDRSSSPKQRIQAIQMVARIGYKGGITPIEDIIKKMKVQDADDKELLVEAIKALATYREPKTLKTLTGAFKRFKAKEESSLRASICKALGEFYQALASSKRGSSTEVTLINKTLLSALRDDESGEVVRAAAYAFGNLSISKNFPRKEAIVELIEALTDPDDQVRTYCKESLELLTDYTVIGRDEEKHSQYQKRWKSWWKKNQRKFRK